MIVLLPLMGYCDEGCMIFGETCQSCTRFACEFCAQGYVNQDGICIHLEKHQRMINNCYNYRSANKCTQCSWSYYKNENDECVKMGNGCGLGFDKNCSFFYYTLTHEGKKMGQGCATEKCKFCALFRGKEICYACAGKYMLVRKGPTSICIQEDERTKGCIQTNDGLTCGLCDYEYVRDGPFCKADARTGADPNNNSSSILHILFLFFLSFVTT